MHGLVPLTEQEEEVKDILEQYGIAYRTHEIFPVGSRTYVADFFLPTQNMLVECWRSISRRGHALPWVEKNACYVDMKFRRITEAYPGVKCVALVEVPQAEPAAAVREYVSAVMEHADTLCCSMEELAGVVRALG